LLLAPLKDKKMKNRKKLDIELFEVSSIDKAEREALFKKIFNRDIVETKFYVRYMIDLLMRLEGDLSLNKDNLLLVSDFLTQIREG